jgi:hypothetical protein
MRAYVHHKTWTETNGTMWRVVCSCGLFGSFNQKTKRRAISRGKEHREGGDTAGMERQREQGEP